MVDRPDMMGQSWQICKSTEPCKAAKVLTASKLLAFLGSLWLGRLQITSVTSVTMMLMTSKNTPTPSHGNVGAVLWARLCIWCHPYGNVAYNPSTRCSCSLWRNPGGLGLHWHWWQWLPKHLKACVELGATRAKPSNGGAECASDPVWMQANFNGSQLTQVFPKCAWPWGQPHRHSSPSWYISPNTHLHPVMDTDADSARLCAGQGEHLLALVFDGRYVSTGHLLHFIPLPVQPAAHAQSVSGKNIAGVITSEECVILLHSYPMDLSKDVTLSVIVNFPALINCSASPGFTSELPWRSNEMPLFRELSKRPGENSITGLLANVTDCTSQGNDWTFEMWLFEMSSICKVSSSRARQKNRRELSTVKPERVSGDWACDLAGHSQRLWLLPNVDKLPAGRRRPWEMYSTDSCWPVSKLPAPSKKRQLNVKFRVGGESLERKMLGVQGQRFLSSFGSPASSKFSLGNSTFSSCSFRPYFTRLRRSRWTWLAYPQFYDMVQWKMSITRDCQAAKLIPLNICINKYPISSIVMRTARTAIWN